MTRCVLLFYLIFFLFAGYTLAQTNETTTIINVGSDIIPEVIINNDQNVRLQVEDAINPSTQCPNKPCPPGPKSAVCASDHKVYDSECQMNIISNCSLVSVDWEECRGQHPLCPSDCLDIQDPVCGEDGRIYPNKCVMHKRNCGRSISHKAIIFCLGSHRSKLSHYILKNASNNFLNRVTYPEQMS